ncbi:MAG: hypothetical protein A2901_08795 [Elusimicrobia bacterium RIFCSPLOWO2_01_FULL_54_10]|nr:MAG: hypothetical protein A2901_08795 [Elusimicrobia bacterium RIFCSPLOWO2_01_FULL_54_10]
MAQKDWILTLNLHALGGISSQPNVSMPHGTPRSDYRTSEITMESYSDAEETAMPRRTLSVRPDLDEIVSVGLTNHRPLEIARMELKLAGQKLFESRRNFLPSVAARGSQSEGSTLISPNDSSTRADFRRKELGIELGQPIFQSGRIYYSQKQAAAQEEAASLAIAKVLQEATFGILNSLYTFLQTREGVGLRKSVVKESQDIMEATKKKRDIGVSSESEYLGVLSAGNQIEYKAVSEEKDFEIARSKLMGVLNLDSIPLEIPISLVDLASRKVPATNLDLDNLIALALSNRPEIKTAYLGKKIKEYARKAARGEYLLKVDASGFVGQSGAAFAQENLNMKDSYNAGLRGTLYFGGSSISPQVSREKTAPDLGSNSRTETRAESVTVGLLDSLGARSNYFQSKIEEEKAKEEFAAQKKGIIIEVKEAFYNMQRARIQIDTARKELEYRKKEAAIAKSKDRLHQIEATQFLQAISGMTEAEVGIREATAYYLTALAALEKATGQPLTR